jgi:uncharacterized protein (TIRG00374 family)
MVLLTLLRLSIVVLAVYLIIRLGAGVGWSDLQSKMRGARQLPLAAAIFFLVARWWIWQHRWSLSLAAIGEDNRGGRRFAALTASILVNHMTPTVRILGGIFRARYLSRPYGGPFSRLYGAVLFDQIVHHAVTGLITWIAVVGAAWALDRRGVAITTSVALLFAAGVYVWRVSRTPDHGTGRRIGQFLFSRARRRVERLGPILDHGRETLRVLKRLFAEPGLIARAAIWSGAIFFSNVTAQWLLFRAVGSELHPVLVAAVVGLGGFAGAVTGTPGGIGSTEAAMVSGYVVLGVARADAVAAALVFRGLHYALVLGCGLPSFVVLEILRRRATRGPKGSGARGLGGLRKRTEGETATESVRE